MSKKLAIVELVFIILGSIIGLGGLTMLGFGIASASLQVLPADNDILKAEQEWITKTTLNWDFRVWGILIVALGVLILVITLTLGAKKIEREQDRKKRRAQRMSSETTPTEEN
jgi:heme exporter protein D